ncbi:MAG TPA: hypothetical protein DCZ01_10805 [Elusimicrobia bacterium]|nr:MAG: hypothetical protein A2X37_00610 [Elusimicrobia bacterium GWA2_66_18]HAZ08981.1 hypothetical protein [Elusimicrobiota bacterium]
MKGEAMKKIILRAVAIGGAAGLCGVIACSDDSSSCGSTNSNNNNNSAITMTCGDGTHLEGAQCVNDASDTTNTNTNTTVTTVSD